MRKGCLIATSVSLGTVVITSFYGIFRVVTLFYDFPTANGDLPAAVAEYQKNGMPFVTADLFPEKVADTDNAASAIRAAVRVMPPQKVDGELTQELKKRNYASVDSLVAQYDPALKHIQTAIDRPKVDFKRDWDLGPYLLLPEYRPMKTLAKAAAIRAGRNAAKGNDEAALADLTLARQVAVWAGQEPTIISMLVRISSETIALGGLERCLDAAASDPKRIARYTDWLAKSPPLPEFGRALRGEAFTGVVVTRNLDVFGGVTSLSFSEETTKERKIDLARLHRSGLPEDSKLRGFLARHLQIWNEAYRRTDGFKKSPREIGQQMASIDNWLQDKKGLSFVLQRILMPIFSQAGDSITQLDARRAVQAGLAEALTIHDQTGRWPTKVSPIDPFTGKPLIVKIKGSEFRVYSIGRDGQDNGGLKRGEKDAIGKIVDEVAVFPPPR